MFIVGIDIAKRSHEAVIITEDGQIVRKALVWSHGKIKSKEFTSGSNLF